MLGGAPEEQIPAAVISSPITSQGSVSDASYEKPVTSGIEWEVLIEPSLTQTLWDNLMYIVPGVIVVLVVVVVILQLRKRRRLREEAEDLEEETPPPKKKKGKKKRPPKKVERDAEEDG